MVTGAFTIEAFEVMKDLQLAVRGGEAELRRQAADGLLLLPDVAAQVERRDQPERRRLRARCGIPVEFISMPLSGFMAPVTLVGTLVQHTAETLSGVVISQLAAAGRAGALRRLSRPSSTSATRRRPMGAVETMMIDCAYSEIGK